MTINRRNLLLGSAATVALTSMPGAGLAQSTRPLRVGLSAAQVYSLDPRKSVQNADVFIQRQLFDSLIDPPYGTFDLDYPDLIMELVDTWEVSDDSRTWTVKLKEGVQFQKGNGEVTSADVKYTYDSIMDPANASTQRVYLPDLESVEIVDTYTVAFHLSKPNPNFHASGLISIIGSILPKTIAEGQPAESFARDPVGAGPYELESSAGGVVTLKSFEGYHGAKPKIERIEFRYMPDPTARTIALLKGDLDIIEGARLPGWVAQLKQQKSDLIIDQTRPGSIKTFFFNMSRKPFDDVRVRKALRYGIDRNVLISAFGGIAGPSWGINPPEYPGGFQENELPAELRYDYDPERAKALLAEAGHPNGLRFEILMTQREDYSSIMLMVQDMWRQIGVDMNIRTIDHTTYHAEKAKNVNAIVLQSATFPPVSTQLLSTYYTSDAVVKADGSGSNNFSHYGALGDEGIDAMLDAAMEEGDINKRQELVRQAELKILEDMPAFTICTLSFVYARNPNVDLGFDVEAGYARYRLAGAEFKA